MTALQLISRALRLIRVADAAEALDASMAQDALLTLNAMLAEWHAAKIGLPDYSLSSGTDTLATDAADSEAIAYQLALRLAPEYAVDVSPAIAAAAMETMGRMRLRYFQPGTMANDLPGQTAQFNIITGDY
jgi:hypothetical protein